MDCYHCGQLCPDQTIKHEDHFFCCTGCETVFRFLHQSQLGDYYRLEDAPGTRVKEPGTNERFAFLDDADLRSKLVDFEEGKHTRITFSIPQIHCSSCIWLLENLTKLEAGVQSCAVNFPKRKATILFNNQAVSLRQVVELLARIGYEPDLQAQEQKGTKPHLNRSIYIQLGVAGFCFGNIMLLAFPSYLDAGIDSSLERFLPFFGYLSFLLALPVMLYAGSGYLQRAWTSIRHGEIHMDVPIALGMLALFLRSTYEVFAGLGPGYFDSLAGLVFFLLIGRWFQQKTYAGLAFDRDFRSYFPIAVTKVLGEERTSTPLEKLKPGDAVELRHQELIPADGILLKGEASIDYSFVTGESDLVHKKEGDRVFAGGKQVGPLIQVALTHEVDNGYLTQLWNQEQFEKAQNLRDWESITRTVGRRFTWAVLAIALATAAYWSWADPSAVWHAVSSVLIVACPCALALSVPFTFGTLSRVLGHHGMYFKHTRTIELLASVTDLIFDKTGTITQAGSSRVRWKGKPLNSEEQEAVKALLTQSGHPLSRTIAASLETVLSQPVVDFEEIPGKGLAGTYGNTALKLGSAEFCEVEQAMGSGASTVYVQLNGEQRGHFELAQEFRAGVSEMIEAVGSTYQVHLLSGDQEVHYNLLRATLPIDDIRLGQSPVDKLQAIEGMEQEGRRTLMLGDGLNDAGALRASTVGLAIADSTHQFSPACDAIVLADRLQDLGQLLRLARKSLHIVYASFAISFAYNLIGLSFAVTGNLSPLVAAILMPLSSVTVVLFVFTAAQILSRRYFK